MEGQVLVFISPRNRVAQFEVEVELRPTVSRPVCLGVGLQSGTLTKFCFPVFLMMSALSDERKGL
jgi:hypothetical protein